MLLIWRDEAAHVAEDPFAVVADDEPAPRGPVIVSLSRLLREAHGLLSGAEPVGVRLSPDEDIEALAPFAGRLAVIALDFPKFRDGRAYSNARLIRERLGFTGQLRAVGDVLVEQSGPLVRCGFDAFEPADGSDSQAWTAAAHRYRHVYQRSGDARVPAFIERQG